tara:strand:- start:256 stop:372 length:117 start_codon:yes stop_codon:yes gene_type:complete
MKNFIDKCKELTYEQIGIILSFILVIILLSVGINERYL